MLRQKSVTSPRELEMVIIINKIRKKNWEENVKKPRKEQKKENQLLY